MDTDYNHTIQITCHKTGNRFTYNVPIRKAYKVLETLKRILEPDDHREEARGNLNALFND